MRAQLLVKLNFTFKCVIWIWSPVLIEKTRLKTSKDFYLMTAICILNYYKKQTIDNFYVMGSAENDYQGV